MCYHPDESYFRDMMQRQQLEERRRRAAQAKVVSGDAGMAVVDGAIREAMVTKPTPETVDA